MSELRCDPKLNASLPAIVQDSCDSTSERQELTGLETDRSKTIALCIEACVGIAALLALIWLIRLSGLSNFGFRLASLAAAPFIGEFAMTMSYRYRLAMPLRQALERYFWPSKCESCSVVLRQHDIFPVLPYLLRRGRCACRQFKIPATCTLAGLAAFAMVAIFGFVGASHFDTAALAAMWLVLSFMPAMVSDVMHGELEESLLIWPLIAVVTMVFPHFETAFGPVLLLIGFMLASALLTMLIRRSRDWPFGLIDVVVIALCAVPMTISQAVSMTVWLIIYGVLTALAVVVAEMFEAKSVYGPLSLASIEDDHPLAFPLVPAIVLAAATALRWQLV